MKPQETFGETVKRLREERNLTLREVAEALHIDTSLLGKIEKNSRKATKEQIKKFAKFFKVSSKGLTISSISDAIAYKVLAERNITEEVLSAAEKKVKYIKTKKS